MTIDPQHRITVECPNPRTPVYVARVDGKDVGAYSSYLDAERAAQSRLRANDSAQIEDVKQGAVMKNEWYS